MATATQKIPLARAQKLSDAVRRELEPACVRIEVAGSIRRRRPEVGDIEIVAIPKRSPSLFDDAGGYSYLEELLDILVGTDRLVRLKSGDKYKQFHLPKADCCLDLFLCSADTWGVIFTIRTGPADFSRRLVTQRCKGGLLPSDLCVRDGRIWRGQAALETPEERRVFDVAEIKWLEPWERK